MIESSKRVNLDMVIPIKDCENRKQLILGGGGFCPHDFSFKSPTGQNFVKHFQISHLIKIA